MKRPMFMVKTGRKEAAYYHTRKLEEGFTDMPSMKEVQLITWNQPHATGYTQRAVAVPYNQIPLLITRLSQVMERHLAELDKKEVPDG
jgi:hypothetical protein